jgi:hypothetical protein
MRSNVITSVVNVAVGFDRLRPNTRIAKSLFAGRLQRLHASARLPQWQCARGSYRGSTMSPSRCGLPEERCLERRLPGHRSHKRSCIRRAR